MESLKTAIGLGDATTASANNETVGHEPVNGVSGAGTADQPFDSGNLEDSHLTTGTTSDHTTIANSKDVAAPLKSLATDETEAAPTGGILGSLASAVGLGGAATTDPSTHEQQTSAVPDSSTHEQQTTALPGSSTTSQGNVEQSHGASTQTSVGTGPLNHDIGMSKHDPATSNQGLQFVGGTSTPTSAVSNGNGPQSRSAISKAVDEGALEQREDPAHSDKSLAFISAPKQTHTTDSIVPKTTEHEPHPGTLAGYTIGQPLGTTQNKTVEPVGMDSKKTATVQPSPTPKDPQNLSNPTASSLFSNPFVERENVSSTSEDADLDPKAQAPQISAPSSEAQGNTARVQPADGKGPPATQSSAATNGVGSIVVEPRGDSGTLSPNHLGPNVPPGAASPKREKGKGKIYGDADSISTRSSLTRNESITTSQTGPSTIDSRRFSSHTSGKIPTAGGIILGERAGQDRERRASLAPSGHSAVTSEPHYGGRQSLQKVAEDAEQTRVAPVTQSTPAVRSSSPTAAPISTTSTPAAPPKDSTDASKSLTSERVPGTESGSLASPTSPPANASRFSEQGIRGSDVTSDIAASSTPAERKPSLVSRIGRKLSLRSKHARSGTSASPSHPDTIAESK